MAKKARKAYQELRDGIEALGGKMWYEQAGRPRGGVWVVQLGTKEKVFEWYNHRFPGLDERYELRTGVSEPHGHPEYTSALRPGAIEELVRIVEASSDDRSKVDEYLDIIQDRILAPIQDTEIRSYCTATLLLLFASIDGLGKLLHPEPTAGSNERIRSFLDYMGSSYGAHKRELLTLRHSLVHNAINVASFLSHAELDSGHHLERLSAADFIYVNTTVMYKDLRDAFRRFRAEIQSNPDMMKRAADRLEWRSDNAWNSLDAPDIAVPSPPPPVEFIYAR